MGNTVETIILSILFSLFINLVVFNVRTNQLLNELKKIEEEHREVLLKVSLDAMKKKKSN